ncbi:MAG: hypothetical protein SFV15_16510 [Polyangiaceae bacterium]|nr:hypothetical protein [Polyangiaceae bacterium]
MFLSQLVIRRAACTVLLHHRVPELIVSSLNFHRQQVTRTPASSGPVLHATVTAYRRQNLVANSQVLLDILDDGTVCRSADLAVNWSSVALSGTVNSDAVWTGAEFFVWGHDTNNTPTAFHSPDGSSWVATTTSLAGQRGPELNRIGVSDTGTFVATNGGVYEQQHFYGSQDGISWVEVPEGAFTPSHTINFIRHGRGNKPAVCNE